MNSDSHQPRVYCLIVAAGKSKRFASDKPKQYTMVSNKTIIQHCVEKLKKSQYINDCHLVIAKDDKIAINLDWGLPITLVSGGSERWQSVKSGVESIISDGAKDHDLILIHDAARPCVEVSDINDVIETAFNEKYGAILATPVVDTIKKTHNENEILNTVSRENLWQAQTPQVFRCSALYEVLRRVEADNLYITDEASGFEQLGYSIKIVLGSRKNIKLTYAEDIKLIKIMLDNF